MSGFAGLLTRVIDVFYVPPLRRLMTRQVFRYAVCGVLNVVLGWVLFYISNHYVIAGRWFDFGVITVAPHTAALYSIVPLTFAAGFYLNRNVAFTRSPLRTRTQLVRYLISWLGALALNHLLLKFFVETLHVWSTPSQVLTTPFVVVYSYLMQKYYTFRGAGD